MDTEVNSPVMDKEAPTASIHVPKRDTHVRDLLIQAKAFTPSMNNFQVAEFFHGHPDAICLAITEKSVPIGMINRNVFMEGFARPFSREIFGKKSCIAYMDKSPLIVEQDLTIEELSELAVEAGEKVLRDGYIITSEGQHIGVGSGYDLMKSLSEMQAKKHRIVSESIEYASIIQNSFLRKSQSVFSDSLADYFLWWDPRDVVGGDCYFAHRLSDDALLFALIDCTGHGVPGAFMTMIVIPFLEGGLIQQDTHDPAVLMQWISREIKKHLFQLEERDLMASHTKGIHQSDEGFDGAICIYHKSARRLDFVGAKSTLYMVRPEASGVEMVDGDRMGAGYGKTPMDYAWTRHSIEVQPGTALYLTTDGLIDQIGGPKQIAFGKRRWRELLRQIHAQPMEAQKELIQKRFTEYQANAQRRDDITIFGMHVE